MSHELRSPLATLVASVEVVGARRDELSGPARQALDLLVDEVAHLRRLVEDLLEISRLEAGVADVAMEDVRVGEFLDQAMKDTSAGAVPIRLTGDAGTVVVRADKRRLERVVGNLITNAERHAGGVAAVAVERHDGVVRIAVEDPAPAYPPRSGSRSSSGSSAVGQRASDVPGGGSGLGLSARVRARAGAPRPGVG